MGAQEDLAIRIVLILENVVLWGFLAALAYIFRCGLLALRPAHSHCRSSSQPAQVLCRQIVLTQCMLAAVMRRLTLLRKGSDSP